MGTGAGEVGASGLNSGGGLLVGVRSDLSKYVRSYSNDHPIFFYFSARMHLNLLLYLTGYRTHCLSHPIQTNLHMTLLLPRARRVLWQPGYECELAIILYECFSSGWRDQRWAGASPGFTDGSRNGLLVGLVLRVVLPVGSLVFIARDIGIVE